MYLLDSDILSLLHAGHERVGRRREDVDPADVATTVITKAEILRARCEFLLKAADAHQFLRAQYWLEQSNPAGRRHKKHCTSQGKHWRSQ